MTSSSSLTRKQREYLGAGAFFVTLLVTVNLVAMIIGVTFGFPEADTAQGIVGLLIGLSGVVAANLVANKVVGR